MKILYVITGADIGGAQRHLLYLAEWFSQHSNEVQVVAGEHGPLVKELQDKGISVTVIPIPRTIKFKEDLIALWKLSRFIKRGKFDVVHSHSSKAGILARLAGFMNRTRKNIFTSHGFVFTDPTLSRKKKLFYIFLEMLCSWLSTDIITVSRYDYQYGSKQGISTKKLTTVHNGIPGNSILTETEWQEKQARLKEADKNIIGFVGRFASEKNLDMLLRVAELFKKKKDVEFWLIGDGPLFNHYQRLASTQHLPIQFKGNQENVLEWMDQMHVMVITSHKEGLPYVLLEACSRGLPVISTDVGGIREVISERNVLVSINDDKSMFEKVRTLLSNDTVREELGKYLLGQANLFTVERMCRETNNVYFKGRSENAIYHHNQSY
nr:glycosyltransferase family 4 protein [Neobacillus sp. Marseille-Q6967]